MMIMNMNLMIVDDEPIVGKRLKKLLEKENYNVNIFTDSEQAIAELKRKHFDIVITDLKMGKIDGMNILEAAKEKKAATKVIIITGYATESAAAAVLGKDAFDFIIKPFKFEKLHGVIKKAAHELIHSTA